MSEAEPPPPGPAKPKALEGEQPPDPSKRRFLIGATAVAGSAAVAGVEKKWSPLRNLLGFGKKDAPEPVKVPETPAELLEAAGLGDYKGVYDEIKHYQGVFGDVVTDWSTSHPFPAIHLLSETLQSVADRSAGAYIRPGPIAVEGVAFFRDGWGTEKDKAIEQAAEKVENLTITATSDGGADRMRASLRSLPNMMPALVNAFKNEVKVIPGGGYYGTEDIGLSQDRIEQNNTLFVAIHEGQHAVLLEALPEIKKYIDRDKFADYAKTYVKAVGESVIKWADNPLTISSRDVPMIDDLPEKPEDIEKEVRRLEALAAKHQLEPVGDGLKMAAAGVEDPRYSKVWEYNAVAHTIAKRWKESIATGTNSEFLQDPDVIARMRHLFSAVAHRFVFDNQKFTQTGGSLNFQHNEVWVSFLNAFSEYEGEPYLDGFLKALDRAEINRRKKLYEDFGWKPLAFKDEPDAAAYAPFGVYKVPTQNSEDNLYYLDYADSTLQDGSYQSITFRLPGTEDEPRDFKLEKTQRQSQITPSDKPFPEDVILLHMQTDSGRVALKVRAFGNNAFLTREDSAQRDKYEIADIMRAADLYRLATTEPQPFSLNTRDKEGTIVSTEHKDIVALRDFSDRLRLFHTDEHTLAAKGSQGLVLAQPYGDILTVHGSGGENHVLRGWPPDRLLEYSSTSGNFHAVGDGLFINAVREEYNEGWGFKADPTSVSLGGRDTSFDTKVVLNDEKRIGVEVAENVYNREQMTMTTRNLNASEFFLVG